MKPDPFPLVNEALCVAVTIMDTLELCLHEDRSQCTFDLDAIDCQSCLYSWLIGQATKNLEEME